MKGLHLSNNEKPAISSLYALTLNRSLHVDAQKAEKVYGNLAFVLLVSWTTAGVGVRIYDCMRPLAQTYLHSKASLLRMTAVDYHLPGRD